MGCGLANPAGLAMQVRREGEDVVCDHVFDSRQVGAPGLAHGGAVAAACDDLFGFVLYLVAEPAVTRTLEVGYRRPVRLGITHRIRARLVHREGRKLHLVAEGTDPDGVLCFDARAVFIVVGIEHFTRYGPARFEHVFAPPRPTHQLRHERQRSGDDLMTRIGTGDHRAGTSTDDMVGVAGYPHRPAGHCGSGSLRDLLEWAGLSWSEDPLDEGTVFGLSGELGFGYTRGPGLGSPFYLVGRGPDLTENLCRRLGIGLEVRATDDAEQGRAWLHEELDAGRPLLCWADMRELPYLRVRMQMSRHDIVVTGYDPRTDQVRVIDNDRPDPQLIPAAALATARASTGFPQPTRHTCYPMCFPAALPDRASAATSAAAGAVHAMRHPAPALQSATEGVAAAGLDGIAVFADDLDRWPELFGTGSANGPDLHTALMTLAAFIEKAGTGGGLFRRLQADFLTWLAATDADAEPAARAYRDLADRWTQVAAAAVSDPEPSTASRRWRTTRDLVSELPHREAAALGELQSLADRAT